ncbi:MAG: outer membrane lipoprotein carrier protein LolA [Syntrophobacterales bacterium]|nr:outer membrane lipoprotein carrier protein LolA [Syntrophobacterales bacterium]
MRKVQKWISKILFLLPIFAILTTSQGSFAQPSDIKEAVKILKSIEQRYHSIPYFSADFIQQIYPPHTTSPSSEAVGRFIFSKPCLMRWEYTSPDEQIVITYPSIGWLYSVRDKEVQVFDTTEFYKSVVARAFLKSILDSFDVIGWSVIPSDSSPQDSETIGIILKPKGDSAQIAQVELIVKKQDSQITRIIGEDLAGTRNVLIFTKQHWNNSPSPDAFMPSFSKDVTISNDKGETISYDIFMRQFQEKKGVLNCAHDSAGKK